MPSPFHRFPFNTSKRAATDREPIEPVPEHYEGYNNPYRGTELHGVEPTDDPRPVPGHASGRGVEYDPPLPEPEPIPVVLRNEGGLELRRSRIYQGKANALQSNQLVGRDDTRLKVRLKNLGTSVVYIGNRNDTAHPNHGWPLAQNELFESETQDELWAISSHATDPMTVAVHVVYGAEL